MSRNKDTQNFDSLKNFSQILILLLILTDIYFNAYSLFKDNYNYEILLRYTLFLYEKGLLVQPYPRFIIILLAILFVMTDKSKKNTELNKSTVFINVAISSLLFIIGGILSNYSNQPILYIILYILTYFYLVKSYGEVQKLFKDDVFKDRYNLRNKVFEQNKETFSNELSVNIPFEFVIDYKKSGWNLIPVYSKGMINIVAPNRATLILGKPGSGKSYSFVEEFIKQHIQKAFSFVVYDFKFPTLTNLTWDYYRTYNHVYDKYKKTTFGVINIDNPIYSHRCNPIRKDLLNTSADVIDAVYTLFYNIDKESIKKQDFFKMSAMAIVTAGLGFLRMYEDGKYCSLPHLIELLQKPDHELLTILDSYDELKNYTSSFSDALKKKSFEQLSGQTASARVPLGKLYTDEMYYVMTDPDNTGISLAVNDPENVTILSIANNPKTKETNAPAMGLYLSQSAKLINAQNRVPCEFIIDELPTIYINGLHNLIATGRSNKVCVTLIAQDYSQLVLEYGKEIADTIYSTVDNKICGKVDTDTGDKLAKAIGKFNYKMQNISLNTDSTSTSFSSQREFMVPSEDIAKFSQAEFAGIVSDTFKQQISLKSFRGFVSPDKSDQGGEEIPEVNPGLTKEDLVNNTKQIRKDVKNIIANEMARLNEEEREEENFVNELFDEITENNNENDTEEEEDTEKEDFNFNNEASNNDLPKKNLEDAFYRELEEEENEEEYYFESSNIRNGQQNFNFTEDSNVTEAFDDNDLNKQKLDDFIKKIKKRKS